MEMFLRWKGCMFECWKSNLIKKRGKTGYRRERESENDGPIEQAEDLPLIEIGEMSSVLNRKKAEYLGPFASRFVDVIGTWRVLGVFQFCHWKKWIMDCRSEQQGDSGSRRSYRTWWPMKHGEWGLHRFPLTFSCSWWRHFRDLMSVGSPLLPRNLTTRKH